MHLVYSTIYFEVCCFITTTQIAGQESNDRPAPPKLLLQRGTVAIHFARKSNPAKQRMYFVNSENERWMARTCQLAVPMVPSNADKRMEQPQRNSQPEIL